MAAGSESAPAMIERIGPIGDVAHEPAAREAAASLVQQPEPLFYGELHVHRRVLLLSCWSQKFAVIADGKLRLYASRTANQPEATYQLSMCSGHVRELEDCKEGLYCFEIQAGDCKGSDGREPSKLKLCTGSSSEQLLWLQAFTQGGVLYEQEKDDGSVRSLHELSAVDMLTGQEVPFSQYAGKVCLVVNVASA